ncbi:MAG: GAF domain-containing protein [Anaerolineae bacterium]|nr:GAF domain-containing protein [Anaerolineae bacterium]
MERQAVSDWRSEVQRRRAILLDYLLLAGVGVGFIAMVSIYWGGLDEKGANPLQRTDIWPFLVGWLVVTAAWRWHGLGYRVRAGILLLLSYLMGAYLLHVSGLPGGGRIWLVLLPALAFVLLGQWPGFAAGGLSVVTYLVFALINQFAGYWLSEAWDFLLGVVGIVMILWAFNRGWVEALSQASVANRQLQAQTEALEETTKQLRATAAVAHACSSILDPEALSVEVVNRIQKEFGGLDVYYAGLFLLDEADDADRRFATLRAATGSVGRQLLEQGYTLPLDGDSAISRCITKRHPVVISGEEGVSLAADSPLRRARSEAALPLYSRGRVLGALSVQSTQEDVFDENIVAVLAAMADQVAVALDNARLFTQTGAALREMQAAQRRYLTEAWKEFLSIRPVTRFDYTQPGIELRDSDAKLLRDARRAAMLHERSVAVDSTPSDAEAEPVPPQTVLAVPLKLRGQVIGALSLHETRRRRPWTSEDIGLAETIAEQVALTVENLRLMDEAQRRATRERLIGDVTGRMRETLDLDAVLQSAAREISEALDLYDVTIHLGVDADQKAQ